VTAPPPGRGRYFAIDGPDGCGKSAQAEALATHLQSLGREVVHLREPGSTPIGEALRALLLAPSTGELLPLSEALLFTAARAELVARVIAPALLRGAVVVAERCFLSTLAYQVGTGYAGAGVDAALVLELSRRAHGGALPDAIFVLDLPPEVAARRRTHRSADRFEARPAAFHARLRDAYLTFAAAESTAQVLDADRSKEQVQQDLRARVARFWP
jgi:dTMP kinase